jgi:hypothetical protein
VHCAGAAKPIRLSSLIYKNLKLKKKEEKKPEALFYIGSCHVPGPSTRGVTGRAHTTFGKHKLQKRKKLHNKLSVHEMHCMS